MNFYMLWLTKVFNLNNVELINFISLLSPKDAYYATQSQFEDLKLNPVLINKLLSQKLKDDAKRDFEFCQKENIKILNLVSNNYPYNLQNIPSPPPILYYKGDILPKDEISISIVGSRKYTEYGKACTKKFSCELASCGITTISGMAYGIDSFSHSYTISAGGRTIAILGSGIDIIYPQENKKLYYDIIEHGAVISEFPLHTPPIPKNFPIRNKIVAGMSLGTLVIEANKKSGTMITARLAGEYGRNIYSIPGPIFSTSSIGTNLLIKDGAKIVTSSQDIVEDIYAEITKEIPKPKQMSLFTKPNLTAEENVIYKNLSLNPINIDKLCEITKLPIYEINSILTLLELNGYIKSLPGKQYVINVE